MPREPPIFSLCSLVELPVVLDFSLRDGLNSLYYRGSGGRFTFAYRRCGRLPESKFDGYTLARPPLFLLVL